MAPLSHAPASSSAPDGVGQASLDFAPRPARAPAPKRTRPAGERAVDPALRLALELLLRARHEGRARAATWADLAGELEAQGMKLGRAGPRRLQEVAELLLEEGCPVVGLSSDGIWWAETADEVEQALRESEKRARKTLRRRKLLRRVWLEMRGQEPIPATEEGRVA